MPLTSADTRALDIAFERLLRQSGIREGEYSQLASLLYDATTEAMTLWVDAAIGTDTPKAGRFADQPFKTIQYAVDQLPKRIRHLVIIRVAAGNYAGVSLNGFVTEPAPGIGGVGLVIVGSHVTATLAQGSATGTITSSVTGVQATPTFTTVTDSTQNWAVDALKGLLFEVGSTMAVITSNTATQVTLASVSAFSNGSAYTIRDWGTVITTPTTQPGPLIQSSSTPTAQNFGIAIRNNYFGVTNSCVIESIRVNLSVSTTAASVMNNIGPVTMLRVKLGSSTTNGMAVSASQVGFNTSVVTAGSTLTGITLSGGGSNSVTLNGSLLTSASAGVSGGVGMQLQGSQMIVSLINSRIEKFAIGQKILGTFGALIQYSGAFIDTNGASQCVLASALGHTNYGGTILQATGLDCRNASAALQVGGSVQVWMDSLQGNNFSSAAIIMDRGSRVQLGASSGITGATDILMDGSSLTIASMRAANPRLIKNDYGTIVFE